MSSQTAVVYRDRSCNASVLLYHVVLRAKYRRIEGSEEVDFALREVCLEIGKRYDIDFLEIGVEGEQVHFLLVSAPSLSVSKIVQIIKRLTAREISMRCPQVKMQLWGAPLWADDYFVSTATMHENAEVVGEYLKCQGTESYHRLHSQ